GRQRRAVDRDDHVAGADSGTRRGAVRRDRGPPDAARTVLGADPEHRALLRDAHVLHRRADGRPGELARQPRDLAHGRLALGLRALELFAHALALGLRLLALGVGLGHRALALGFRPLALPSALGLRALVLQLTLGFALRECPLALQLAQSLALFGRRA